MDREIPGPFEPAEISRFLESYYYDPRGFFIDEVVHMDAEALVTEAIVRTDLQRLPLAQFQRIEANHPGHVAAGELIMITGCLGALHAWFYYGCRWDEGWAGFGSRIHRADFKSVAKIGPPLRVIARESKSRAGAKRVILRADFEFYQEDRLVYRSDQTAMFFAERDLD